MLNNNPIFSQDNLKRLGSYLQNLIYVLKYDANDTEEQMEAAEKLALPNYFMALLADHFFGYFPASYFLTDEEKEPYKDFVDDLKQDPKQVLEITIGLLDDAFDEVEYIEYPDDELYRKPKRKPEIEQEIISLLIEIHNNFDEFYTRLFEPPHISDPDKPSEQKVKSIISAITRIQDYMLSQGEAHNQLVQAFQYSKMLETFKLPLLFGWEKYKYGWHSDFWKEGDSMFEYDMFLFNADEHMKNCIEVLNSDSPFKHFENNGQLTAGLIDVISDIRKRLDSGEFKL